MASFPRHHLKIFRTLAAARSQPQRSYSAINHWSVRLSSPTAACAHLNLTSHVTVQSTGVAEYISLQRNYSSQNSSQNRSLPTVMEFPNIVWPSIFKTVKNWIMVHFIIRPYFDQEFSLPDFVAGSKHAVEVVSGSLGGSDMQGLNGLVASEALDELRATIPRMSMAQRGEIPINKEDIYLSFPYQVGIMFDETNDELQKRWVEITMVFHVLRGLQEMRDNGIVPPLNIGAHPEFRNKISICNYRFIKEFTQGHESDWTINVANHFKPADDLEDD